MRNVNDSERIAVPEMNSVSLLFLFTNAIEQKGKYLRACRVIFTHRGNPLSLSSETKKIVITRLHSQLNSLK